MDEKPWGLQLLEMYPYLHGVKWKRAQYREYRPGWDHDHCVSCWTKFMVGDSDHEPIQHEGYTTTDEYVHGAEYEWVCLECWPELKDVMQWSEA